MGGGCPITLKVLVCPHTVEINFPSVELWTDRRGFQVGECRTKQQQTTSTNMTPPPKSSAQSDPQLQVKR